MTQPIEKPLTELIPVDIVEKEFYLQADFIIYDNRYRENGADKFIIVLIEHQIICNYSACMIYGTKVYKRDLGIKLRDEIDDVYRKGKDVCFLCTVPSNTGYILHSFEFKPDKTIKDILRIINNKAFL